MKKATLCFIKPLSFSTFLEKVYRKKKAYTLWITVSAERPEKYVWGTVYEAKDGKKRTIRFDNPSFGIFNPLIARMIKKQIVQNKSAFDFVSILSCCITFCNVTPHHAKVYHLQLMDVTLRKSVYGRIYKKKGDIAIVFDKPDFGVLTPLVSDALLHELIEIEALD